MRRMPVVHLAAVAGALLAPFIFAQSSSAPSKTTSPPKDYTFRIAASQVWTDTGLDLEPGDRVHIYGKVMACEGPNPSEKAHLPLPSAPGGALLAKLHGEANPILASPDADLPIIENSRLYLGVNGWACHGILSCKVHVEWHKRPQPQS
jgi:hypothetical protein